MRAPSSDIQRSRNRNHSINRFDLAREQQRQHTAATVTVNRDVPNTVLSQEFLQGCDHGFPHNAAPAGMRPESRFAGGLARQPVIAGPTKIERWRVIQRHELQRQGAGGRIFRDRCAIEPSATITADVQVQPAQWRLSISEGRVSDNEMLKAGAFLPPQLRQSRGQRCAAN